MRQKFTKILMDASEEVRGFLFVQDYLPSKTQYALSVLVNFVHAVIINADKSWTKAELNKFAAYATYVRDSDCSEDILRKAICAKNNKIALLDAEIREMVRASDNDDDNKEKANVDRLSTENEELNRQLRIAGAKIEEQEALLLDARNSMRMYATEENDLRRKLREQKVVTEGLERNYIKKIEYANAKLKEAYEIVNTLRKQVSHRSADFVSMKDHLSKEITNLHHVLDNKEKQLQATLRELSAFNATKKDE
jgi:hypothetical protein